MRPHPTILRLEATIADLRAQVARLERELAEAKDACSKGLRQVADIEGEKAAMAAALGWAHDALWDIDRGGEDGLDEWLIKNTGGGEHYRGLSARIDAALSGKGKVWEQAEKALVGARRRLHPHEDSFEVAEVDAALAAMKGV